MSTSAIERKTRINHSLGAYLGFSIFCAIFSAIYEYFGHGIISWYMVFMCLFPLILGVLPFFILRFVKKLPAPDKLSRQIYACGIITLTFGSCFMGILEIYGTSSPLTAVYWMAGIGLTVVAAASYALHRD